MKISSINNLLQQKSNNTFNFKGIVAHKNFKQISTPCWDYGYEAEVGDDCSETTFDYYPFSDESIEDTKKFIDDNTYCHEHSDDYVNVKHSQQVFLMSSLPVTRKEYRDYINNTLSEADYDRVEKTLRKNGYRQFTRPKLNYDEIV